MRETAVPFVFDRERLLALASRSRERYASARPFPHIVFDDFLPDHVLDEVLREFPAPDAANWWRFDSAQERKLASPDAAMMGLSTRGLLLEFNSAAFVDFLRDLTGIEGLVPDPHYFGGGLHQIEAGGYLNVHADFNRHPITGLVRRLNVLLYLNREWREAYGGALELWDSTMSKAEATILPAFNRCVVFSISDIAFHGHPTPLRCPQGTTRKSLALYYYTRDDPGEPAGAHNTLFQTAGRPGWKRAAERALPPAVVDVARRVGRTIRERRRPAR
jgi:2-oxoglutarate-Fe(II)-dependent oxygenase superfamily protein